MEKFRFVVLAITVLGGGFLPGIVQAAEAGAVDTAALIRRLDDLEQQVAMLRQQLAVQKEAEDKKAAETPVVMASAKDGFVIKSPDEAFKLKLGGYIQADGRFFTDNDKSANAAGTTDIFTMRRVRPTFSGTVQNNFDYVVTPSFDAGTASLQDAWMEYRYLPEIKIKAGQFKAPFGLERLQSNANTNFVEATYPTGLTPNYDTGLQVSGDVWGGVLNYAVALANGTSDGAASFTDINNDKEVTARLIVSPFKLSDSDFWAGLSGGAAVSHGHKEGAALPTLRSPGQAAIFTYNTSAFADGPHTRFSPQLSWYYNQFGLLSEYVSSEQKVLRGGASDSFENTAWAVTGGWVLTGEDASYKGVVPLKPFDPAAQSWGAWELVGRYHELNIDDSVFTDYPAGFFANPSSAVARAASWGIGTNWYLSKSVKLQMDFEHTDFGGGNYVGADTIDRSPENTVFTRFQLSY